MARGLPSQADVVVIGGGIAGAATAAFLAEGGASVALVEREAIAAGASGRNSGVVQAPLDPVLAALYRDTLIEYRRLAQTGAGGFALPVGPAGLLHVTREPAVAIRLAAQLAATHPELGAEFLDGEALARLEPSLDPAVSACRVAIGYPVAPAAATRAYAALAERHGVRSGVGVPGLLILEGSRVVGVRTSQADHVSAEAVVVAAGPWTPEIVDPSGAWRPIRPVWGVVAEVDLASPPRHVLEEAEIDDTIEPTSAAARSAAPDPSDGFAFSLVTAAGRSVLGSTFLEAEPDADALIPAIRERGARFVPALADAPLLGSRPLRAATERRRAPPRWARPVARRSLRRRGPRAVGHLDRPGHREAARGPRARTPGPAAAGPRPGPLRRALTRVVPYLAVAESR
ncbi:MAG: FAD-dependent oxidoreductase [Chloroflexota bacterium]